MGPPELKMGLKRVSKSAVPGNPENTENTENTENMKIVVLLAKTDTFGKMRNCQESELTNFLDSFVTADNNNNNITI